MIAGIKFARGWLFELPAIVPSVELPKIESSKTFEFQIICDTKIYSGLDLLLPFHQLLLKWQDNFLPDIYLSYSLSSDKMVFETDRCPSLQ